MPAPKGNKYAVGAKSGAPPRYKTVEEMQTKIDEYFEHCKGKPMMCNGEIVYTKSGDPFIVSEPPTVTGLALYLGFTSRLALLNYQDKDEFVNAVTRAKARVEQYANTRLFDRDGCNGAKFTLTNNFGYSEKVENINHNLNTDLSALSDEEIENRLKELGVKIDENE